MSFSEWKEVTLAEISKGGKGNYGIAASAVEYSKDLLTYLRITDISDDGTLNKEGLKSVDDENAEKYLLKPNDIVFARTGNSTGRSYFYDGSEGELVFAGFLIKFSLDQEKVNPKFIRYYTLSSDYRNWISSFSTGSTRKNINAKTYAGMTINLPPRKQQDYLVNILSTLDEKIEINNQINKNLEEMAQAIFKHWFVDFEFPNEEGKPYKSSGGEMVESELGLIPKGWEVKAIEETLDFVIGGDWGKEKLNEDFSQKTYCIRGADFPDLQNGIKADIPIRYIKENSFKKRNLLDGDIILEISGGTKGRPTGRTIYIHKGMTNDYDNVLSFSNFCRVMRTNNVLDSKILYLHLQFLYDSGVMETHQVQSTGISNFQFKSFIASEQVVIPDKGIQDKFSEIIEKLYQKRNTYESYRLKLIRDTLLPKLMSGEIRVPLESESDAS